MKVNRKRQGTANAAAGFAGGLGHRLWARHVDRPGVIPLAQVRALAQGLDPGGGPFLAQQIFRRWAPDRVPPHGHRPLPWRPEIRLRVSGRTIARRPDPAEPGVSRAAATPETATAIAVARRTPALSPSPPPAPGRTPRPRSRRAAAAGEAEPRGAAADAVTVSERPAAERSGPDLGAAMPRRTARADREVPSGDQRPPAAGRERVLERPLNRSPQPVLQRAVSAAGESMPLRPKPTDPGAEAAVPERAPEGRPPRPVVARGSGPMPPRPRPMDPGAEAAVPERVPEGRPPRPAVARGSGPGVQRRAASPAAPAPGLPAAAELTPRPPLCAPQATGVHPRDALEAPLPHVVSAPDSTSLPADAAAGREATGSSASAPAAAGRVQRQIVPWPAAPAAAAPAAAGRGVETPLLAAALGTGGGRAPAAVSPAAAEEPEGPVTRPESGPAAAMPAAEDGQGAPDLDELTDKVLDKLTRRLAVEGERRGWRQWP